MNNAPIPPPPKAAIESEAPARPPCAILNSSPEVAELFAALSKAQAKFTNVKKDAENTFFKSNYATLAAIVEMIRKPMADNGLAFMQSARGEANGKAMMNTIITHSSGQYICSSIPFSNTAAKPQDIGSAITYAKRYGLQTALGIVVADDPTDDDGNVANGNLPPPRK